MPTDQMRLDVTDNVVEELMDLARFADRLSQIVASAGQIGPQVGTSAVARKIADKVGIPAPELRRLIVFLLNFYHTQVKLKTTAEATVEAISESLKRRTKSQESKEELITWGKASGKIADAVKQLGPNHPLEASYKAFRVASTRQYGLASAQIFTDARPVFNEEGDAIVQTVISHVLSLDYQDGHDRRVLQLSVDAADLVEIKKLCERAERKANIIKRDLGQKPWPTSIFREPAAPESQE